MKKLLLILICILFTSCATNYYINVEEDTPIYKNSDGNGELIVIPKGNRVYVTAGKKKYRKIKWAKYKGWAINPVYNNSLVTSSSSDTASKTNTSLKTNYRSSSTPTSSGGTVYVKGYTRKDGTYVQPHTRKAPKRR